MYICICNVITESQLLEAIDNNEKLPTGNSCCFSEVLDVLKELNFDSIEQYNGQLNKG